MNSSNLATCFAPPERASPEELLRQQGLLSELPILRQILDGLPGMLMVLNDQRQIVLANRALQRLLGCADGESLLGLRPGEALGCVHAGGSASGCGTSEFCCHCGAVRAILAGQRGETASEECRVSRGDGGAALDLRVQATPFLSNGDRFVLLSVDDIADEKRRLALERVFFHDVLNTVGNLKSVAELLADATPGETSLYRNLLVNLVDELTHQITEHRDLLAAESDQLTARFVPVRAKELTHNVAETHRSHELARGRPIRVVAGREVTLSSDPNLLRRILANMVKNALEASREGEETTLGWDADGKDVTFWVRNPGAMPRSVQLQVFQRSFSTKGPGRGLGTYGMKLLADRYLGGEVSFTSAPDTGTCFRVRVPAYPVEVR